MSATDALLTSDYSLDKIIYMDSGSVTIPAFDFKDTTVPHGLLFTPLLDGTWSNIPDFSESYDISSGPLLPSNGALTANTSIEANSTNYTFRVNNNTSSTMTIYYRIFGLEPSNTDQIAEPTASLADFSTLNTDFNYTKLFKPGIVTSNTTIFHNLGHRPQVKVWAEFSSGIISNKESADINDPFGSLIKVTESYVQFTFLMLPPAALHYRIYLDE